MFQIKIFHIVIREHTLTTNKINLNSGIAWKGARFQAYPNFMEHFFIEGGFFLYIQGYYRGYCRSIVKLTYMQTVRCSKTNIQKLSAAPLLLLLNVLK